MAKAVRVNGEGATATMQMFADLFGRCRDQTCLNNWKTNVCQPRGSNFPVTFNVEFPRQVICFLIKAYPVLDPKRQVPNSDQNSSKAIAVS